MGTTHEHEGDTSIEYWENFYRDREQIWSRSPNPLLVREVTGLIPGAALDLGCGEGADAVWLASRGWRVTAVDVSATALGRAAELAVRDGVAERIDWQRHDLAETFPAGSFELVSAQFFHSPVARGGEREKVLRLAADAVAPGGTLLIVGHAEWPSWVRAGEEPRRDIHFPTNREVLDALQLPQGDWRVEVDESVLRELTGPDGLPATRRDCVLRLHRIH